MINIEVLFSAGKLISLGFMLIVTCLVLLIVVTLNQIVKGIINSKPRYRPKKKIEKKEAFEHHNQKRTSIRRRFAENITDKYLDLTGRNPKFRN